MEAYTRKAVYSKLKGKCSFAKENDFIEVCEWKNEEGYDITISDTLGERVIQLTIGELELIKELVKKLEEMPV